jgi:hypothetical protein
MKTNILKHGLALLGAALLWQGSPADAQVEFHPKQVGASIDLGQIVSGYDRAAQKDWSDLTLTRTGVYLTTSATVDKKLDFYMTIGGLFWYPVNPGETTHERLVRFGPGVGQAQVIYAFGDHDKPTATFQVGLFPVKYSDATNLGEYLYRSGTYPGSLVTGGWSYLNSASYLAQGARFVLPTLGGKLTHELTVFMERDYEPTSDFSPGYLVSYKPTKYLELGAGVVWAHALSMNPDRLSPNKTHDDTLYNGYSKITNRPMNVIGKPNMTAVDTATMNTPADQIGFYTFKGWKTMGRASLDAGALLGWNPSYSGDFKVYGEIALLGIEDQPYYYEDKTERMPMMAGVSIPTFGLLDKLSFEVEYFKSRFPNTVGAPFYYALPLPLNDNGGGQISPYAYELDSYAAADRDSISDSFKEDDWHWSVYASRKITEGVNVYAQIASDHQRHPTGPEVKPSLEPPTIKPSDWYYVVRVEFGLF